MASSPPDSVGARPRIVLVEDDAALERALVFALTIEGYEVEALDGAEALLAHPLVPPVVIVMDENIDAGLQALASLRRRGVVAPAILLVTDAARGGAAAARAGVVVIEKPILGDRLVAALQALPPSL